MPGRSALTLSAAVVESVRGRSKRVRLLGREVRFADAVNLIAVGLLVAARRLGAARLLADEPGTAMRATGDNPRMIRSLGVDVGRMITLGLMMSNALVALSGAILAQYQGFADIQMGIGMIVWGLASVILGQALVGTGGPGLSICGRGPGLALVPADGGAGAAVGARPERLETDHGRLCLRGTRAAQGVRRLRSGPVPGRLLPSEGV